MRMFDDEEGGWVLPHLPIRSRGSLWTCTHTRTHTHTLTPTGVCTHLPPPPRACCSLICVYTLKNVGHPEYTFTMESGVMSLDFHPQHPALLAVGCYDGTVKVR